MDDATYRNFETKLPWILSAMSKSSFVSLDLEFSGLPSRKGPPSGKQTLQERYTEIKQAAEKYQILQIGFTTVGHYIMKTWKMHLNPLVDSRLNVERTWSYQSDSISFLLKNGFRMHAPMEEGVPYLSRREEEQAIQNVFERKNRSSDLVTLDIPEGDTESLEFLQTTREAIDDWLAKGEKAAEYLNIPTKLEEARTSSGTSLNRFQKRLVHQLVGIEYPFLRSIGKLTFVQIIQYDENREKDVHKARLRLIEERCQGQYGVRWIIEAFVGGDLSKLDPNLFSCLCMKPGRRTERTVVLETAARIKMRLKKNPPVLVGHNLFVDMVYLWQCFFGYLPERVEDFQSLLHHHFPLVIDTKYLATHDCGDINPIASLDELNESLTDIDKPDIVHTDLPTKRLHDAGYDSYLTAKNFLKLACRLPKEHSVESLDNGGGGPDRSSTSQNMPSAYLDSPEEEEDSNPETLDSDDRNVFHGWDMPDDDAAPYPSEGSDIVPLESEEENDEEDTDMLLKIAKGELIPRFHSGVWKAYANKLRVFGTQERVMILGESE